MYLMGRCTSPSIAISLPTLSLLEIEASGLGLAKKEKRGDLEDFSASILSSPFPLPEDEEEPLLFWDTF